MAEVPSTLALAPGSPAPDFTLPDPTGRLVSLDQVRGPQGLVVAFLCNHCPFVLHLADELGRFAQRCSTQGIGFVGINANDIARYPADSPAHMAAMESRHGWHFPYLFDDSQAVARAYQAACTPDFYLFDGGLQLFYCGQFDESRPGNRKPVTGADLAGAIAALLAGQAPPSVQRPSSGCNIKWKPGQEPGWFNR